MNEENQLFLIASFIAVTIFVLLAIAIYGSHKKYLKEAPKRKLDEEEAKRKEQTVIDSFVEIQRKHIIQYTETHNYKDLYSYDNITLTDLSSLFIWLILGVFIGWNFYAEGSNELTIFVGIFSCIPFCIFLLNENGLVSTINSIVLSGEIDNSWFIENDKIYFLSQIEYNLYIILYRLIKVIKYLFTLLLIVALTYGIFQLSFQVIVVILLVIIAVGVYSRNR